MWDCHALFSTYETIQLGLHCVYVCMWVKCYMIRVPLQGFLESIHVPLYITDVSSLQLKDILACTSIDVFKKLVNE